MPESTFGDLLCRYRRAAGLSQFGLAERAGISPQTVGTLERGTRTHPRRETVLLVAEALDLTDAQREELLASAGKADDGRRRPRYSIDSSTFSTPRSLPLTVADFTGRGEQVDQLRSLLTPGVTAPAVVVSAIEGMGGVGKTALAVHVAHLLADEFPDGQLYVNLRGVGPGEPMTTDEALDQLLGLLGIPPPDVAGVDQAAGRYRSVLAGRRVLVVLDNAADAGQVMPLIPGTAGCAAIITSRRALSSLPGAHHLQLDVLPEHDAVALLAAIVGGPRIATEPEAAVEIVRRCGHLPLAIRMAGARLVARPRWPIAHLVEPLADERRKLDELRLQDVDVRTSFAVSLRQLTESDDIIDKKAIAAFSLLGLPDGPDLGITTAARLLDKPEHETEQILERLVDAYLLSTPSSGRYRFHDLLRTYAREQADATLTDADRAAALTRVLIWYNSVAWRIHELWRPHNQRRRYVDERWLTPIPDLTERAAAPSWLDPERPHLVALVRQCAGLHGVPNALINQLAMGLTTYYSVRQQWADQITVGRAAIEVAAASGDPIGEAFGHNDLGGALNELGHHTDAALEMERAVAIFRSVNDLRGEASSLCNLGHILERNDRLEDAVVVAQRALDLNRRLGDHHRIGQAWLILGVAYGRLGNDSEAIECVHNSRECFREIGHEAGLADAAFHIGEAHVRSGQYDAALAALDESMALYAALAFHGHLAESYYARGSVCVAMGRYADGVASARAALSIAVDRALAHPEAEARFVLGMALAGLDRHTEARREWARALEIYEAIGSAKAAEARALLSEIT